MSVAVKKKKSKSLAACFPKGFTPRPLQAELLPKIQAAFDAGKRFVVVEAPPGVGKTHLAMAALEYFGNGYVCTATKLLQDQYTGLFGKSLVELKGRGAYRCERARASCAVGGIYYNGKDKCGEPSSGVDACPYHVAKAKALDADFTVTNYSSLLYNCEDQRGVIVLDEGHEIEEILMNYVEVSIKGNDLPVAAAEPIPAGLDVSVYFAWLERYLADLSKALQSRRLGPEEMAKAQQLHTSATFALTHKDQEEWIVEGGGEKNWFSLKPLTVKTFGEMLFHFGEHVLILSATILDYATFADSIGIDRIAAEFITAPCPFPVENRPIYVGNLPMTYKFRDQSWPMMVKIVENILNKHSKDKGLILAPSNEMLQTLVKGLPSRVSDRLVLAYGDKRIEQLKRHLEDRRPTVLAASGMWEGVDLKDNASRFQIIPSLPRAHWSGQVAERGKMDPRWYRWKCMTKLVQGVGRSIRSETDSAVTYVLDKALRDEANKKGTMLPEWFLDALQTVGD